MASFDEYFNEVHTSQNFQPKPSMYELAEAELAKREAVRSRNYHTPESVRYRQLLARAAELLTAYHIPTQPHTLEVANAGRVSRYSKNGSMLGEWSRGVRRRLTAMVGTYYQMQAMMSY